MSNNPPTLDSRNEIMRLLAEIASGITALREEIRSLTAIVEPACAATARLAEELERVEAALAARPVQEAEMGSTAPATIYRDFHAETILLTYDDSGNPSYKIKGQPYTKFGVRVWPETLPVLGIDPAALKPGPNPVAIDVRAMLNPETGKPRKITGLAPAAHGIQFSN